MTKEQFRAYMNDTLSQVDYDIKKQFDEETAEEPEFVEGSWEDLEKIARQHNLIDY